MVNKLTGLEGGLEVGQKINEIIDAKADVNSNTTGNAGTATKLKNARTITLSGDISGSYSFDGSANKSVTTSLNNTTKIDGQWVSKTETLSTATAVGTYTIDLSSYLPNDNYNYEMLLSGDYYSNDNTAGLLTVIDELGNVTLAKCGSYNRSICFAASIVIGTTRTLTFKIEGKKVSTDNPIYTRGYRRIGLNT